MHNVRNITSDILLIGGSDRRLSLFENVFPVPRGVSYNAYLVRDEKTVLLDTADSAVGAHFYENLEHALQGRPLDYIVINHMEPDHCSTLGAVLRTHPKAQVVASAKAISMIGQFFDADVTNRCLTVKEGDTLSTGRHTLTFVMAPMVHWPEVMVTYDAAEKVLFSADAFGTFGALNGNIFADEVNFKTEWLPDARRYYTNIVGKYGAQVQTLLKKAAGLDIQYLCPLHGPIWREDAAWFVEKYQRWSRSTHPDKTAAIFCGSISATRKTPPSSWPPAWRRRACGTCGSTTCPTPMCPSWWPRPSGAAIWCSPPPRTTGRSTPPWTTSSGI